MSRPRQVSKSCAALICVAGSAGASPTPSVVVNPAPAGDRAVLVGSPEARGHRLLRARVVVDWASEPLVLHDSSRRPDVVVSEQQVLRLMASYALHHRWLVGLSLPVVRSVAGDSSPGATTPRAPEGPALGDVSASLRVRLLGEGASGWRLAGAGEVWAPTGSDYAGDAGVQGRGELLLGTSSARADGSVSVGAHARPAAQLGSAQPTRVGSAATLGAAVGWRLDGRGDVRVGPEVRADFTLTGGARLLDPRSTVVHALASARWTPGGGPLELLAAVGPDLGRGAGAADWRAFLALGWSLEQTPPPPDRDDDGVPDATDACVELAGEAARDPLMNGCPEAPPDRDEDSIPDAYDACPRAAGVATGERRTHGCPVVALPPVSAVTEPLTAPGAATERIEIVGRVLFETGSAVLSAESDHVLGGVAEVMAAHPEIELVEVQGHTDGRGDSHLNRGLSTDRARAVVSWLVARGVAAERLSARGFGFDRPIASDDTEAGRASNRRVEFVILRRAAPKGAP